MLLKPSESFQKSFVEQMQKVNYDSVIKLITKNMQNGILPLTDATLKLFKKKHSKSKYSPNQIRNYHCRCSSQSRAKKGGYGSSGMVDADCWKRILTSKQFFQSSTDLCTTIVNMIKKLWID